MSSNADPMGPSKTKSINNKSCLSLNPVSHWSDCVGGAKTTQNSNTHVSDCGISTNALVRQMVSKVHSTIHTNICDGSTHSRPLPQPSTKCLIFENILPADPLCFTITRHSNHTLTHNTSNQHNHNHCNTKPIVFTSCSFRHYIRGTLQ